MLLVALCFQGRKNTSVVPRLIPILPLHCHLFPIFITPYPHFVMLPSISSNILQRLFILHSIYPPHQQASSRIILYVLLLIYASLQKSAQHVVGTQQIFTEGNNETTCIIISIFKMKKLRLIMANEWYNLQEMTNLGLKCSSFSH